MPEWVLFKQCARHAVLTLNRPEKRNPLPYKAEHGLLPALQRCLKDERIRVVVLAGAGPAFCSGLDLEGLQALQKATPKQNRADSKAIRAFFETVRRFPKPLIAAVEGPAVAGGAGLALACDTVVVSEHASFRFSEVAIGFVPALVGVMLERAVGSRLARELLLSARTISAAEAKSLHLANEVVASGWAVRRAEEIAQTWAENSPEAMRLTKALLAHVGDGPYAKALDRAEAINSKARGTRDCREGIRAFLEKRKPDWTAHPS